MSKKELSQKVKETIEQFGFLPDIKLSKKEKLILQMIADAEENIDFYYFCEFFDMKPSKLDDKIDKLILNGLLDYSEDADDEYFSITELGLKYLNSTKADFTNEKKFKKFLECMNEEELRDFCVLCDEFKYTEPVCEEEIENAPDEEKPEQNN